MLEPEKVKLDFEHICQIGLLGVRREAVKETQRIVYHAEILFRGHSTTRGIRGLAPLPLVHDE